MLELKSEKRSLKVAHKICMPFLLLTVCQAKDRQKKKPTKAIRLDAEGDATLEDLTENDAQGGGHEHSQDAEKAKSCNKKVFHFILVFWCSYFFSFFK